jgi:hypothetical protein
MKDDIIRMAREAGLCDEEGRDDSSVIIENHIKRFAELARAAEREEIAKMFDGKVWSYDYREIAAAIRARGNT